MAQKVEGKDGIEEDADVLNLPPDVLEQIQQPAHAHFGIDHANWRAWLLFLDCSTQWRVTFSGPQGIDYTALHTLMKIHRHKDQSRLLRQVQLIERGALAGLKGVNLDEVIG